MADIELIQCPYSAVHLVKRSRFQIHLSKCRRNHMDTPKFICPFNATHVYPEQEKIYHLESCEDRAPLDRAVIEDNLARYNPLRGRCQPLNVADSIPITCDEDWGNDNFEYVKPTPPPDAILMPAALSKPAERRHLYQNLQRMYNENTEASQMSEYDVKPDSASLSRPNLASNVQPTQFNSMPSKGRGTMPNIASVPVPRNPPNCVQGANTSVFVFTPQVAGLGLGRGTYAAPSCDISDDKEFPPLGLGRGNRKK